MLTGRRQSIPTIAIRKSGLDLANPYVAKSPHNEEGDGPKAYDRIAESRGTSFAANFVADRRRHNRGHREIVARKSTSELQNGPDSVADNGAQRASRSLAGRAGVRVPAADWAT